MDSRGGIYSALRAGARLLTLGWSTLSFLQAVGATPDSTGWLASALISFVVFVGLVYLELFIKTSVIESKKPNIELSGQEIEHILVGMSPRNKKGRSVQFIRAVFANSPKNPTDQNWGRRVRALVSYKDIKTGISLLGNHDEHLQIDGRWSQSAQPPTVKDGEQVKLESMDFPSNGAVRYLDLLIKYREDLYAYAYNNSSYLWGESYFRRPDFQLASTEIEVKIELRGEWFRPKIFYFELDIESKGDIQRARRKPTRLQRMKESLGERLERRLGWRNSGSRN